MNKLIKNKKDAYFATLFRVHGISRFVFGVFLITFSLTFFQPSILCAQAPGGEKGKNDKSNTTITLNNPLGDKVNDLPSFVYMILEIVFEIGAVVSVLAIIYVGFMFVRARGNSEELVTARRALLYTVIGIAVLLGAVLIATVIDDTITDISTGI